jgi:hypothetical protein
VEKYSLKERVARIESVLEQMDKRLSRIEKRPGIRESILESEIKGLRSEMVGKIESLGDEVNDLRRVPNNESPWILGVRLAI